MDYSDGRLGKVVLKWRRSGVTVSNYISDSDYRYNFSTMSWQPVGAMSLLDDDDGRSNIVNVRHGQMVYVGQLLNGTITGQGKAYLSWCGQGKTA